MYPALYHSDPDITVITTPTFKNLPPEAYHFSISSSPISSSYAVVGFLL